MRIHQKTTVILYWNAWIKFPHNKAMLACVNPQAGQGKLNNILKGHTVPKRSCVKIFSGSCNS